MSALIPLSADRDSVRIGLRTYLPWTPHDFIRTPSSFFEADQTIYIESLTRDCDAQDDLRFIYRAAGLELVLLAERLPWDSDFFGYDVARINGIFQFGADYNPLANYHDALRLLVTQLKERGVRYVFMPVFPEDLATLRALTSHGFVLIETRAYYHRSLKDYNFPERFPTRVATAADVPVLGKTAQEMVNSYDRFHADPFIKKEHADHLMYQWVEASINDGFADVTLVPDVPTPTAFCTVKYHTDHWERWGLKLGQAVVLGAVSPEFRGWYMKLTSECNYHLAEIGAEHCFLVTQITNRATVRSWEKLGFRYGRGEHIFRLVL